MTVPDSWEFVLLALASYRVWRLVALDVLLDRPRDWAWSRAPAVAAFATCPWCSGWWISVAAWIAWVAAPTFSVWASVPLALSAVVGFASTLDSGD